MRKIRNETFTSEKTLQRDGITHISSKIHKHENLVDAGGLEKDTYRFPNDCVGSFELTEDKVNICYGCLSSLINLGILQVPATSPVPPAHTVYAPYVSQCNDYRIANDQPLSSKQRACIYASNLVTTSGVLGAGFGAAWAQLMKTDPPDWGHGPEGYAKSYGTRYSAGIAKATSEYLTALARGEDPRPRRSTSPNKMDRVLDAMFGLFVDTGQSEPRFAVHTLAGAMASGFSGMAYYPAGSNTVGAALKRSGMSLAGSLAYAELWEFEPDLFGLVRKWFTPKVK